MMVPNHIEFLSNTMDEITLRSLNITNSLESGDSFDEVLGDVYKLRSLIQDFEVFYFSGGYPLEDDFKFLLIPCFDTCGDDLNFDKYFSEVFSRYNILPNPGEFFPVTPINIISTNDLPNNKPVCSTVRQEILVNTTNPEILIPLTANKVDKVFLNGVLLDTLSYWFNSISKTITFNFPNVVTQGDRLIIFYSDCDSKVIDPGVTSFSERFIYTGDTIFLQFAPTSKHQLFINGQYIDLQDYDINGLELILNADLLMQNGDEIVIFYFLGRSVFLEDVSDLSELIKTLKEQTQQAASNASISEQNAAQSEANASISENNSAQSELNAQTSASNALDSELASALSAQQAEQSNQASQQSALVATDQATQASTARNLAEQYKIESQDAADISIGESNVATQQAGVATTKAGEAEASRQATVILESQAQQAKIAAQTAQGIAQTAASTAIQSNTDTQALLVNFFDPAIIALNSRIVADSGIVVIKLRFVQEQLDLLTA